MRRSCIRRILSLWTVISVAITTTTTTTIDMVQNWILESVRLKDVETSKLGHKLKHCVYQADVCEGEGERGE